MSTWFRRAFAVLLACTAVAGPALAVDESDLLPVDQAFALDASAPTRDGIELRWRIADGYYLYRHRISVQADPAFHAGALDLPRGASHHDEFFGDVETYRTQLQATLPGAPTADTVTLKVKYQGCADLGVCYPPQTRRLTVALPAATASDAGDAGFAGLGAVARFGQAPVAGRTERRHGRAAAAAGTGVRLRGDRRRRQYAAAALHPGARAITSIATRHRCGSRAPTASRAGQPRWPPGARHRDEHFGDVVVYFDQVDVPLPLLRRNADAAADHPGGDVPGLPDRRHLLSADDAARGAAVAGGEGDRRCGRGEDAGRDIASPDATPVATPHRSCNSRFG